MTALIALIALFASDIPPISVIVFIVGIAFWLASVFYGWKYAATPRPWIGYSGLGLMILAIGLRVIFGV